MYLQITATNTKTFFQCCLRWRWQALCGALNKKMKLNVPTITLRFV